MNTIKSDEYLNKEFIDSVYQYTINNLQSIYDVAWDNYVSNKFETVKSTVLNRVNGMVDENYYHELTTVYNMEKLYDYIKSGEIIIEASDIPTEAISGFEEPPNPPFMIGGFLIPETFGKYKIKRGRKSNVDKNFSFSDVYHGLDTSCLPPTDNPTSTTNNTTNSTTTTTTTNSNSTPTPTPDLKPQPQPKPKAKRKPYKPRAKPAKNKSKSKSKTTSSSPPPPPPPSIIFSSTSTSNSNIENKNSVSIPPPKIISTSIFTPPLKSIPINSFIPPTFNANNTSKTNVIINSINTNSNISTTHVLIPTISSPSVYSNTNSTNFIIPQSNPIHLPIFPPRKPVKTTARNMFENPKIIHRPPVNIYAINPPKVVGLVSSHVSIIPAPEIPQVVKRGRKIGSKNKTEEEKLAAAAEKETNTKPRGRTVGSGNKGPTNKSDLNVIIRDKEVVYRENPTDYEKHLIQYTVGCKKISYAEWSDHCHKHLERLKEGWDVDRKEYMEEWESRNLNMIRSLKSKWLNEARTLYTLSKSVYCNPKSVDDLLNSFSLQSLKHKLTSRYSIINDNVVDKIKEIYKKTNTRTEKNVCEFLFFGSKSVCGKSFKDDISDKYSCCEPAPLDDIYGSEFESESEDVVEVNDEFNDSETGTSETDMYEVDVVEVNSELDDCKSDMSGTDISESNVPESDVVEEGDSVNNVGDVGDNSSISSINDVSSVGDVTDVDDVNVFSDVVSIVDADNSEDLIDFNLDVNDDDTVIYSNVNDNHPVDDQSVFSVDDLYELSLYYRSNRRVVNNFSSDSSSNTDSENGLNDIHMFDIMDSGSSDSDHNSDHNSDSEIGGGSCLSDDMKMLFDEYFVNCKNYDVNYIDEHSSSSDSININIL